MYLEDECPCRGMGWIIRWGGVMTGLVGHMTPDGAKIDTMRPCPVCNPDGSEPVRLLGFPCRRCGTADRRRKVETRKHPGLGREERLCERCWSRVKRALFGVAYGVRCTRCGGDGAKLRTWCRTCGTTATCDECNDLHKNEVKEEHEDMGIPWDEPPFTWAADPVAEWRMDGDD